MSGAVATTRGETHTVTNAMNDYGAMTVSTPDTHETRQIVGYASERIRGTLAGLDEGESVRLRLRRAGTRANVWEVAELLPGR